MESTSVESFCNLLARSKLLSGEDVRSMRQRWLKEGKESAADLAKFTRWLVTNQYVTDYQASLLRRGHADGFFLNEYKLLDRIGAGRMAGVYKAVHRLGQTVAIKVLPPSKAKEPQILGRFQREARLALRLKHPNVVRTYHTGKTNNLHYLVMEYLEGDTLEDVLKRRKKLPPAEAVRLIHQALLGLQALHDEGIIHRDLKPGNLMLVPGTGDRSGEATQQATVKILDIGLGRALFDEGDVGSAGNIELTATGDILGTPDYMAPEQTRDAHKADIRSDIYSLGCCLFHSLAGKPPFPDPNLVQKMVKHATEPVPELKKFNADVPDGLQQIVNWMMAKDPAQRYPTPARAAQALQVFLASGAEAPVEQAEPQKQAYLEWLESHSDVELVPVETQAPVAAPVPMAVPTAAPIAVPVAASPLPAAASGEGFSFGKEDDQVIRSAQPQRGLSRRDYLMMGLGVGGLILVEGAVYLGYQFAQLMMRKRTRDNK